MLGEEIGGSKICFYHLGISAGERRGLAPGPGLFPSCPAKPTWKVQDIEHQNNCFSLPNFIASSIDSGNFLSEASLQSERTHTYSHRYRKKQVDALSIEQPVHNNHQPTGH